MTTVLVSAIGGHLAQLHTLLPRIADVDPDEVLWVTHDSPQSRSLLAGCDVRWVPYIDERDVRGVIRAMPQAVRVLREIQPDRVISTGSAIAGAWLPAAAACRREALFIESAAMVDQHTRTGRLLQLVPGVRLFTQSLTTASRRWKYCGSVFEGFEARQTELPFEPKRVVVSLGTSPEFGFDRLLDRLVGIVPAGVDVLWQTGETDVSGYGIEARPWVPGAELSAAIAEADLVVTHAGAGSALAALLAGKRPVLVPRLAVHGEFRDDHQLQIARFLADRGLAVATMVDELTWTALTDATGWAVNAVPDPAPLRL